MQCIGRDSRHVPTCRSISSAGAEAVADHFLGASVRALTAQDVFRMLHGARQNHVVDIQAHGTITVAGFAARAGLGFGPPQ